MAAFPALLSIKLPLGLMVSVVLITGIWLAMRIPPLATALEVTVVLVKVWLFASNDNSALINCLVDKLVTSIA